jgi:hypothetical protein
MDILCRYMRHPTPHPTCLNQICRPSIGCHVVRTTHLRRTRSSPTANLSSAHSKNPPQKPSGSSSRLYMTMFHYILGCLERPDTLLVAALRSFRMCTASPSQAPDMWCRKDKSYPTTVIPSSTRQVVSGRPAHRSHFTFLRTLAAIHVLS